MGSAPEVPALRSPDSPTGQEGSNPRSRLSGFEARPAPRHLRRKSPRRACLDLHDPRSRPQTSRDPPRRRMSWPQARRRELLRVERAHGKSPRWRAWRQTYRRSRAPRVRRSCHPRRAAIVGPAARRSREADRLTRRTRPGTPPQLKGDLREPGDCHEHELLHQLISGSRDDACQRSHPTNCKEAMFSLLPTPVPDCSGSMKMR